MTKKNEHKGGFHSKITFSDNEIKKEGPAALLINEYVSHISNDNYLDRWTTIINC